MVDYNDMDSDIGLGDEDKGRVKSKKVDWYKGEKGRTDRVALVYFNTFDLNQVKKAKKQNPALTAEQLKEVADKVRAALAQKLSKSVDELSDVDLIDTSETRFKVTDVHYSQAHKELGYLQSRIGKDGANADAVWQKLGPAESTVSTLLLIYPTDRDGEVDKNKLLNGWKLMPWKFKEDKFRRLRTLNKGLAENGLSISSQDLRIECKETQFQQLDINTAGPAIWMKNEAFKRAVLQKAVAMYDKLNPAREMTTQELSEKLGLSSGSTGGGSDVSTDDFSSVLAGV